MLSQLVAGLSEPVPSHYSQGLRLRPNYLIYTLAAPLSAEQRQFLQDKEIPWAEYPATSPLGALVAFLRSVRGGLYLPTVSAELGQKQPQICLFLLDPHLIDDFERIVSRDRRGVLMRRHLLASQDFKDTIEL